MWPRLVHKVQCQQSKWILLLPSVAVCGAVWHGFVQLSYTNTCLATRPSVTPLLVSVLINGWAGNTSLHYRLTIAPWHAVFGASESMMTGLPRTLFPSVSSSQALSWRTELHYYIKAKKNKCEGHVLPLAPGHFPTDKIRCVIFWDRKAVEPAFD